MKFTESYSASGMIADAARSALSRARSYPPDTTGAILLSWSAVEGFMNEVHKLIEKIAGYSDDPTIEKLAFFLGSYDRESDSVMKQMRALFYVCRNEKPSDGTTPFQDLDLLRRVRNELTHLKPDVVEFNATGECSRQTKINAIVNGLRSHAGAKLEESHKTWLELLRDERVAQWAVATMAKAAQFVVETLPDGPAKHHAKDYAKGLIDVEIHP